LWNLLQLWSGCSDARRLLFLIRWCQMLDQRQLSSGLKLPKVDLIHKRPDEKDAAAGAAQEILWCERIRKSFGIHPFSLVGDGEDQGSSVVFEAGRNLFCRIVVVAMQHRIDGCFANGHGDTKALILVEAGLTCELVCGGFNLADFGLLTGSVSASSEMVMPRPDRD